MEFHKQLFQHGPRERRPSLLYDGVGGDIQHCRRPSRNRTGIWNCAQEQQSSNSAKLIASFAVEPGGGDGGEIPLPAGAWLMLTGIGLLGAAKRRTKKT